jgi:predicted amidophosphoribosyltransferase
MVYCSRCGREVDSLWTHCPYCGAPLTPAAQQPVPEKRKDRRKLVAALVGLSGLLGLGYVAYRYYGDEIIAIIERLSGQAGQPIHDDTHHDAYNFSNNIHDRDTHDNHLSNHRYLRYS